MKRTITFLFLFLFAISTYSQTTYWTAYNVEVAPGAEANVANAIDKYMNSEVGKTMPAMYFRASIFANSETKYTHQFVFLTQDKSVLGKMYSGILQQTNEFQLLGSVMGPNTSHAGSYLGKSLYSIGNVGGRYTTIVSMGVSDPGTYLAAFKKMTVAINAQFGDDISASLHQVLSGNEEGVSHLAVVSAPSFDMLLDFWDKFYATNAFMEFNKVATNVRKVVANTSVITLKEYNMPK
jgi:hypothetical protein